MSPLPGPPDGTDPHVVVDEGVDAPVLDESTLHHLSRVLRLRPGDALTLTDGRGTWRTAVFTGGEQPEPLGPRQVVPRPEPVLTVCFALTKGAKPDWTVQKLVELGIDRIVPFTGDRSVVRWTDDKAAAQVARWRAVARAAVGQSRQCWLPEVADLTDTAGVVALGAAALDRSGAPLTAAHHTVAVGPEGGWSTTEREVFTERVRCSPHVLRAETAALTAGALMGAIRSETAG